MAEENQTSGDHTTEHAPSDDHSADVGVAAGAQDVHTSTEAHGGDGHGGGAFPPFNAETFAPQLIWLLICFVALYVLMSRVALPRIGEVLEERSDRVQRDLSTAERLKSETDEALEQYEQALADARSNAGQIAKETRERLAAETDGERKKVEAELEAKLQDAEKRIDETRSKALGSVDEIATDVASSVVSKLIGVDISADEVRKAVAAAGGK